MAMKKLTGHEAYVAKVRKLLALAESANAHEAELALSRAQDLAERYNLDLAKLRLERPGDLQFAESERVFFPGGVPELHYLADLMKDFFFCVTLRKLGATDENGTKGDEVSVYGEPHNIEIGIHTLKFLVEQFRALWRDQQERNKQIDKNMVAIKSRQPGRIFSFADLFMGGAQLGLGGLDGPKPIRDKNAYYLGLANSLIERLTRQRQEQQRQSRREAAQSPDGGKSDKDAWGLVLVSGQQAEEALKDTPSEAPLNLKEDDLDKRAIRQGYSDGFSIHLNKVINGKRERLEGGR